MTCDCVCCRSSAAREEWTRRKRADETDAISERTPVSSHPPPSPIRSLRVYKQRKLYRQLYCEYPGLPFSAQAPALADRAFRCLSATPQVSSLLHPPSSSLRLSSPPCRSHRRPPTCTSPADSLGRPPPLTRTRLHLGLTHTASRPGRTQRQRPKSGRPTSRPSAKSGTGSTRTPPSGPQERPAPAQLPVGTKGTTLTGLCRCQAGRVRPLVPPHRCTRFPSRAPSPPSPHRPRPRTTTITKCCRRLVRRRCRFCRRT